MYGINFLLKRGIFLSVSDVFFKSLVRGDFGYLSFDNEAFFQKDKYWWKK